MSHIVNRRYYIQLILSLCIFLTGCSTLKIVKEQEGYSVIEAGNKVLFYQVTPKSLDGKFTRNNYIHPLYNLDGQIITEDFPKDHLHHRGIFWAWHQVFIDDKSVGDSWQLKDISWDVAEVKTTSSKKLCTLKAKVLWKSTQWTDSDGKPKSFISETTTITVHAAENDLRKIDFEISLLALEDKVRIGGSNNKRGYGGFSTRIKLPEGISFSCPTGNVEPKPGQVDPSPWFDFSAKFGDNEKISGLAVLSHKSNPGYPQPWILRRKRSMQNPVYPGRHPVRVSQKEPLILRYRLIIHRGDTNNIDLNKLHAEYNSE